MSEKMSSKEPKYTRQRLCLDLHRLWSVRMIPGARGERCPHCGAPGTRPGCWMLQDREIVEDIQTRVFSDFYNFSDPALAHGSTEG